ncbi:CPBP family intramembrane glutamic endopeptidase [Streptomyces sp. NPDC003688]
MRAEHSVSPSAPPSPSGGPPSADIPPLPTGPRARIRRRPLTWFFLLAFALSWLAWTPYVLSENGLAVWHFAFPGSGGASQLLGVLPGAYLGPITSAFVVTAATDGRPGLRVWLRRMGHWRVGWRWYAAVVLSVPAVLTLSSVALAGRAPAWPSTAVLVAYVPGLVVQMVTTGLAEEPGWRDFAMPRMQRRHSPVVATLIVGVLWGLWHLPLYLSDWGGWPDVSWDLPLEFVVTTVAFSFVMTWVFNRTNESLPLAMLCHTSVNNFISIAWSGMFPSLSTRDITHAFLLSSVTAALVVIISTRGRLGLPAGSESFDATPVHH